MDAAPTQNTVSWRPSRTDGIWITVLGLTLAFVACLVGFVVVFQDLSEVLVVLEPIRFAVTVGLTMLMVLVHEVVHGVGFLAHGGRPRLGVGVSKAIGPYISCIAPGLRLPVGRYVTVRLAPTIVLNAALVAGLLSGAGSLFILPFGAHLAGCVEDWVIIARALRAPEGSLIEDIKDGLIIHTPGHAAT